MFVDVLLNDLEKMSYSKAASQSQSHAMPSSSRNSYKSSLSSGSGAVGVGVGMHQRFNDRASSDSMGSASYASNSIGNNFRPSNGNELFIEKINRLVSTTSSSSDYNHSPIQMIHNRMEPIKPIARYGDELPKIQSDYGKIFELN